MDKPEQITFFAKTDSRGQQIPFGIKAKDRTKHVYVIGKTGMGKSTLLENMAVQDMQNGNGLAFIDPHGATAETLLRYVPEERIDDVLYFAPFDSDNPISFNVMEDVGPDKRHLVVSGLMSVFKKIWVDAWSARMEYILSNVLLALLEYPDSTLLGVNRMLSDKHYRKKVVENITDPAVRSFWVDEFANYNERYMQEAGDAIKNKIGQFTSNPIIRNIVGQPKSSFDIRELMDSRKIIIANLSKGLVGESNANLLGSMLTTRIYLAAMSRADLTHEELANTPNFYFYVDEFQSFANATFADILSEARKYKLNLTIAHQYIEQMDEEVRNAVFGNVGTIISFRVGPFDAEILETIFTPRFLAADIVNLGFAQIYLTLMIDGIGSQPFSAVTLPPITTPDICFDKVAIAKCRERYAKSRAEVETMINAWHDENHAPPKPHAGGQGKSHQQRAATDTKRSGQPGNQSNGQTAQKPRGKQPDTAKPNPAQAREKKQSANSRTASSEKKHASEKQTNSAEQLNELRGVLATITKSETKPDTRAEAQTTKSADKTNDKRPKDKDSSADLKSALSAVLTQSEKKHSEPSPEEKKSTSSDGEKKQPQTPPAHTAPQEAATNTLSRSELERMMRVTGSDKNPLH